MYTGTVKFFNASKGFGYITSDQKIVIGCGEGTFDVFVHITAIQGDLIKDKDRVEFEIGQGKQGPVAVKVRKIESETTAPLASLNKGHIENESFKLFANQVITADDIKIKKK